jgi:outer membrane protein assembly factor BamD
MIHYKQMEKADRDPSQALRAEDECRQLIVQFPNSKFVDETQQLLRNIQEALADAEFKVGIFYYKRGSNFAAANRLNRLVDQYPLYSKADEALWDLGESYSRLGNRFRPQEGESYARIVKDYPLSEYADNAKKKLRELEMPVPEADQKAVARMQWERENRQKAGMISKSTGFLRRGPDVSSAARSGAPAMTTMRPGIPLSVPQTGGPGFTGDVTATTVSDSTALDTKPDARANPPGNPQAGASDQQSQQQTASDQQKSQKKKKKDKKQKPADSSQPAPNSSSSASSSTTPKP